MSRLNLLIFLFFLPFVVLAQNNEEKVIMLIDGLETGDPATLDLISDEMYIQHNLAFPNGKEVLAGFFTGNPTGIETTNARVFSDGDIVVAHSIYAGLWNNGVPQVAFDVFRFEEGLIVEHWDNLTDIVDDMDGTSQTDGPVTPATDLEATEDNRAMITTMMQEVFVDGTWSKYADYFDTTANYVQHSPGFGPDATAILQIIGTLPDGVPFYKSVEFIYVAGNFALTMSEGFPDDSTGLSSAYYDLFRIENGKIMEHWDVIQEIPPVDQWANSNGKWGSDRLLSNEEKVVALIDGLETGDPATLDLISDEIYIQHNLAFPDGKEVLAGFFTGNPTGIETTNARVFSDGDIVVAHSIYAGLWNNGVPQVAFDVFRFEEGLIVEHWDNLTDIVDDMDGTSQTDGPVTPATDLEATEDNRMMITTMMQEVFVDGTWSKYADYFDTTANYVQHSPGFGPDATAILQIIGTLPDGVPFYKSVEFIYVAGNFALTMSEGFPDDSTGLSSAYYDLFRIEDGKIMEHWDVIQEIPPVDQWANSNGKWGSDAITAIQDEIEEKLVRIYPVPVRDMLGIESESLQGRSLLRVLDLSGRTMMVKENVELPTQLDVNTLPNGYYLLEISNIQSGAKSVKKFIKQ